MDWLPGMDRQLLVWGDDGEACAETAGMRSGLEDTNGLERHRLTYW